MRNCGGFVFVLFLFLQSWLLKHSVPVEVQCGKGKLVAKCIDNLICLHAQRINNKSLNERHLVLKRPIKIFISIQSVYFVEHCWNFFVLVQVKRRTADMKMLNEPSWKRVFCNLIWLSGKVLLGYGSVCRQFRLRTFSAVRASENQVCIVYVLLFSFIVYVRSFAT